MSIAVVDIGVRAHGAKRLFLLFCLLLLSGALQRPVGGDLLFGSMAGGVTRAQNPMIMLLGALTYGVALVWLALEAGRVKVPVLLYPIIGLNLWAVTSCLWSIDPEQTLARAAGLSGSTVLAIFALSLFSLRDFMAEMVRLSMLIIMGTLVLAIVMPDYAYHGVGEFYGEHAGLLRGSFVHKNALAKVLCLCLVVLCTFGWGEKGQRIWVGVVVACGIGELVLCGSAKSFACLPVALAAAWGFGACRSVPQRVGLLVASLLAWGGIEAFGLVDMAMSAVLGVLERDVTLSGRTAIWQAALAGGASQNMLLGGGYEASWQGAVGDSVRAFTGYDPGHPHNGFLQTFLDLGLVGLGLLAAHLAIIGRQVMVQGRDRGLGVFIVAWMAVFIFNNMAGSFVMLPADLYWLLLVVTPAMPAWDAEARVNPEGS